MKDNMFSRAYYVPTFGNEKIWTNPISWGGDTLLWGHTERTREQMWYHVHYKISMTTDVLRNIIHFPIKTNIYGRK